MYFEVCLWAVADHGLSAIFLLKRISLVLIDFASSSCSLGSSTINSVLLSQRWHHPALPAHLTCPPPPEG